MIVKPTMSVALVMTLVAGAALVDAQGRRGAGPAAGATTGSVEHITVHGKTLEGNLEGDSPDREVTVYLPPSYAKDSRRRYPVLYMLHGYTDSDEKWMGLVKHWINLPEVIDRTLAAGGAREMMVVMP